MAGESENFLLLIIAFLFPPAAVAFVAGCGPDLLLNILLTLIGWLPGCIHAFWLIFRRSEANDRYGPDKWTYSGMGKYQKRDENAVEGQQQPTQPSTGVQEQVLPPPAEKQAPPPAQKQGENSTPQDNQKATHVASSQSAADQKVEEPAPQYTPVATTSSSA